MVLRNDEIIKHKKELYKRKRGRIMKACRYIAITMVFAAAFMLQQIGYAQVSLKDIDGHWAKKEITEMVEKKFILGYPDGTFKPDKEVTKLDALIMASRVLGVDNASNKEEAQAAEDTYSDLLSSYNIYGKREVSFLLSRKVLSDSELDAYIKGDNAKANTKRYEAAIIFTKIMGKENDVKNKTFVILPFMDSQQIPLSAKPYVEFMTNQEIMNGVTKTEFRPNDNLTRAQIAVMLLRVSNKLGGTQTASDTSNNETTMTGTISDLSTSTRLLTVISGTASKSFTLLTNTSIKVDGSVTDYSALKKGFGVTVKTKGQEILEVNATSRQIDKTVVGCISSITTTPSVKIGIAQGFESTSPVEYFPVDGNVHITRNGNISLVGSLRLGDYVTAKLLANGDIAILEAEDSEKTMTGVVESLQVDDKVLLTVTADGKSTPYEVMSNVTVSRNNSTAGLKDVKTGDRVTLTLRYKMVKNIIAQSDRKSMEGTIEEILIAKDPKLTVKSGTTTTTYNLSKDAVIKVDGVISEMYDLRLGCTADFDLDSNVIVGVSAEKKFDTLEVRGTVKMINLNLGVITIAGDNETDLTQIYVNSSSTKVNNVEKSTNVNISDIKAGQEIIAYGKTDRGVFVTSLIVITSE